jgi:hypothetical protein
MAVIEGLSILARLAPSQSMSPEHGIGVDRAGSWLPISEKWCRGPLHDGEEGPHIRICCVPCQFHRSRFAMTPPASPQHCRQSIFGTPPCTTSYPKPYGSDPGLDRTGHGAGLDPGSPGSPNAFPGDLPCWGMMVRSINAVSSPKIRGSVWLSLHSTGVCNAGLRHVLHAEDPASENTSRWTETSEFNWMSGRTPRLPNVERNPNEWNQHSISARLSKAPAQLHRDKRVQSLANCYFRSEVGAVTSRQRGFGVI